MGRAARSAWACHARPTATSVRRSPATGSSSRSSTRTRAVSYPTRSAPLRTAGVVPIDLNRPMEEIRAELSKYPVTTRVSLSGALVVARDGAHAKLKERVDAGKGLPDYFKRHPVYYAGPSKTPKGYASGSFGPTTAGRMDVYVDLFQSLGGSMVMLAKGN